MKRQRSNRLPLAFWMMELAYGLAMCLSIARYFTIRFYTQMHTQSILINGAVGILEQVSFVFVGLFSGLVIDRYARKSVMVVANFLIALFGWLPVLFASTREFFVMILIIDLILSGIALFGNGAVPGYKKYLLKKEWLVRADGISTMITSGALLFGITLSYGGFLFYHLAITWFFIADSVTTFVLALILLRPPKDSLSHAQRLAALTSVTQVVAEIKESFRLFAKNPFIVYYTASVSLGNGGSAIVMALIFVLAARVGSLSTMWLPAIVVGFAMMVSGALFSWLAKRIKTMVLIVIADIGVALCIYLLPILSSVTALTVLIALYFILSSLSTSSYVTLRIRETPEALQGRFRSIIVQVSSISEVLIVLLASFLGSVFHSLVVSFAVGSVCTMIGLLIFLYGKWRGRFTFTDLASDSQ